MSKEEAIKENQANPWFMLIPTMLAAFMFVLDETIANIALPHIAGSFSVSNQESIWILTSYLIASCLTVPMIDWLVRLMGRKSLFISMVALFTTASFICGISTSMGMMIVGRFLQGLGGGVLVPIAQAVTMENFKGEELARAMGIFGMVVILAPILGPVIGGYITENWSWNWIFFINVPIGIVTLWLSKVLLFDPPYAQKHKNVKTDYWGIVFLFMFAVAFETMMDKGNDLDWFASPFICKLTVIWVIGLTGFIISQIKQKDSLVKFNVFKNWNYSTGTIAITVMNAVLLGSMAMIPQFMQNMMGYDAFTSGLSMMPRGVGCFIGCILSSKMQTRFDPRFTATVGIIFLGIGSWMLGSINLNISSSSIAIPNVLYGFGMSLGMMSIITSSCQTIAPEDMSNATGLQNFIKTVGGAIGTSLVATFVSRFSQTHQNMMIHTLTETNNIFMERLNAYTAQFMPNTDFATARHMAETFIYNQLNQQSHLWAYIDSFRIFAVASIFVLVFVFIMRPNKS